MGNECIRWELCLCSAVKGASSCASCASVQHENLAAYAILRKVLIVATICFVWNDAFLNLIIRHVFCDSE